MPFLPFMPDVDVHLHAFKDAVLLSPGGPEAIAHTAFKNPQLPESAAMDHTPLQASAIDALVNIRNSEEEMRLAALQAQAIARSSKISAARAYEALLSWQRIFSRESAGEEQAAGPANFNPAGAFKTSLLQTGFLDNATHDIEGGVSKDEQIKEVSTSAETWRDRQPEGDPDEKSEALKAIENPDMSRLRGVASEEAEYDVDTKWYLKNQLEDAFKFCKDVSIQAAQAAREVTERFQKVRHASRAVTEALNLPGAPLPPPFPPTMLKPPRRPRDLPPAWLDVPFGISHGGDPYMVPTGTGRPSTNAPLRGVPGFNPFEGNVPMHEQGLSRTYPDIKPKDHGGKLKPGFMFPDESGSADEDDSWFGVF